VIALLYGALGAAAGVAQSALLRRGAGAAPSPFGPLLRMLGVGAALLAGALAGQLWAAVAGWSLAFALTTVLLWRWS
jgi:hypothetical protein